MNRTCALAGFALILLACGSQNREPTANQGSIDTIQLTVTDTIGIEMGDSCYVFGYAADAARTDSLIYVLDMSRAQLRTYTPEGEWAGYIGGQGNGPGELVMPHWMELFPDGSILIQDVTDLGFYSPSGEWQKNLFVQSGNWPEMHTVLGQGTFAMKWHEFIRDPSLMVRKNIASYDLEGELLTEFFVDSIPLPATPENNTEIINRTMFSHYFTGDLQGNLYLVTRHVPEYRILCLDSEGVPFDTLELDLPVVERTQEEMDLVKRHTEEYLNGMGTSDVMEWIYEPDSFKPPVSGIWLGWLGNLWVLRGNTEVPTFDVWSIPEGRLIYTAELDLNVPPEEFLTFYVTPWCEDFLAVHEDEFMVQRVLLIDTVYPL
jgi:hypothetical protein